jgi:hypothetical protein
MINRLVKKITDMRCHPVITIAFVHDVMIYFGKIILADTVIFVISPKFQSLEIMYKRLAESRGFSYFNTFKS